VQAWFLVSGFIRHSAPPRLYPLTKSVNPLATKLRFCLVRPHMMPTKTSVGTNEVVRLEVLRLIPPLRSAARHWACAKSLARACAKSLAPPTPSARPSAANARARHRFLASASGPKLWPSDVCAVRDKLRRLNINMAVAYIYL